MALKRRSMAGGQQRFVRTPSSLSRTNFWKNSCSLHFLPSFLSSFFPLSLLPRAASVAQ